MSGAGESKAAEAAPSNPAPPGRASDDDFDFSGFEAELGALVGDQDPTGGDPKEWEKLMQDALQQSDSVIGLEVTSEEESEQLGSEEDESSSVPSESGKFKYHPDDVSEMSDEDGRRYLIETHSFMHLKDPGLADALLLKEIAPEKIYRGIAAEKHDYKKLCEQLGVQPIQKFLRNIHAEELDLSWFGLSAKDIIPICKVLCNNTHIMKLSLRGNAAGLEGGEAIAEMIENNYTITHLDIARTEILKAAKKICEAVSMNIVLEVFDMSRNDLGNKEMVYISGFLKETTTLRELYLSRNLIEDPGLIHLSKGIYQNTSLELIDLAFNRLRGMKSTFPFFESIANHPAINSLDLQGNSLKEESSRGICRIMAMNSNFNYMNISMNRIGGAVAGKLGKSLAKSFTMTKFIAGPNLWNMGHLTQGYLTPMIAPLTNAKNEVPLELLDLCYITTIYKQFQKVKQRAEKLRPDLQIIHGPHFGLCKGKKPNAHALVIRRAKIVCENFATPLEMLMDELRTEPKTMNHMDFKKFIKSCNLYKDKVMTQSFFDNFPTRSSTEVDCEAILAAYDKEFPKALTATAAELTAAISEGHIEIKRERDTSIQAMMKW